jgi:hypothetical protein
VAPDHPQAWEWATALAGHVGKLLGGASSRGSRVLPCW